ncbi:MAG: hypothetical protein NTW86_08635 [Candidatus Sumerlaeota bacterium]|nr:hypothetical protein [Candidatus Sumerlaeota bacterium]
MLCASVRWTSGKRRFPAIGFSSRPETHSALHACPSETASGYGTRIPVRVESQDAEVNGMIVSAITNSNLAARNRLTQRFEAATGKRLEDDMEVDLKEVLTRISHQEGVLRGVVRNAG